MSRHICSVDCLGYQMSAKCRCGPFNREGRESAGAGRTYHGPNLTGSLSSEPGIQGATQMTIDKPTLTEHIDNPCSIAKHQRFRDDISYASSYTHQITRRLLAPRPHNLLSLRDHSAGSPVLSGGGDFLESIFSLAWPEDRLDSVSPTPHSSSFIEPWEESDPDAPKDPENVQGAVVGFLALDRNTESNGMPFLLQTCAEWFSHFMFDPLSVVNRARGDLFRNFVRGEESRQLLKLLATNEREVIRSAEYNPAESSSHLMIAAIFRQRLAEAASCIGSPDGLDRQHASEAMLFLNQWIPLICKVASLSSTLDFMKLAAPVFRRACPDPLNGLVNLPTLFTTMNVTLISYITMDVLLAVLTGRPMFFRYTINFTPEVPESLFSNVDAPGFRWVFGVPDRLLITFAQMNGLLEDFGPHVSNHVVDELENEIKRMKPILGASTEPSLLAGRMVVQECWFLAALIYLYMGLCGDRSTDTRVVNVRTQFMKLLALAPPRRSREWFLTLPMVILGLATDNWDEQNEIRERMLGVPECARSGRMGNDFLRMLDCIWSKGRPAVWSDLRQACWDVAGV